ncbi:MAG: IclR family transcriptional regulator [Rhodospirillaceae bacterium]|jgi:DNA-binding IclR family transcriptional regulator|nr:IclR family transcriptional regulator [Rhodospirillales bacterium]MBT3904189.1 IclR family transcriptional regulator [Rhodospirillaceae bacterium]MBT4701919.1 IclR family transcriptional regulator [Rhodospirillaceae bacterium]MBT5035411.1 IclR family transcriptional regulator [Rhodospirillaceae bacterium]MBT6220987.1 IclR family transcriptional regulator [Rhodospirillaceae bacterium]
MKTNRSVERAISVLVAVCQSDSPMGLTEISRGAGLDKATTLRLLTTLGNADMVRQEGESRCYLPGAGIYNFWPSDIRSICHPHLQALLGKTQETVCLITPRGNQRVCRDSLEPDRDLRIVAPVGREIPIFMGASGRAMMAFMPEAQRDRILDQVAFKAMTAKSVTDRDAYIRELDEVRQCGYAFNVGEVAIDTSAIAAPVFDGLGNVVAAVVLRAPDTRLPKMKISSIVREVVNTARDISAELKEMQTTMAA